MTQSARRLDAAHGRGSPHLWRWAGLWVCTHAVSAVGPTLYEAWDLWLETRRGHE